MYILMLNILRSVFYYKITVRLIRRYLSVENISFFLQEDIIKLSCHNIYLMEETTQYYVTLSGAVFGPIREPEGSGVLVLDLFGEEKYLLSQSS